ncbi:DUF480 domain-containing protein [Wenzhouxiangella sp. AB-CW3]|uniref:YceH family protein n=1 Tax=Wenzhouxiangella sp. AB-CW3 TaxID=2771012 RepID=UPI00168B6927|nr:DUF480 domain-containing protein [Wenzhouxiangella sp. AB-CW3]QOC22265.1 DUF480 domain-containing protein [Wenzhouxiangella sp. AB-CW3]
MTHSETPETMDLPLDPPLDAAEARVLGCLMEKEATTPDNYPLTQNATISACNQKSSRDPIMKLDPGTVGGALRSLERRELVRSEFGARASRYRHQADRSLELTAPQRAVLALLLLRGPQTGAELFTRSERLHAFDDVDEVLYTLERLASRDTPLVVQLPRQAGQRGERFMHRLCGEVDVDADVASGPASAPTPPASDIEQRLADLEERVAELESRLDDGD